MIIFKTKTEKTISEISKFFDKKLFEISKNCRNKKFKIKCTLRTLFKIYLSVFLLHFSYRNQL